MALTLWKPTAIRWAVSFASLVLFISLIFFAALRFNTAWTFQPVGGKHSNVDHIVSTSLSWHAPDPSEINDLASVINGSGIYGFIFNDSTTPANVPYNTYNWCNMPHVRRNEYVEAPKGYKLEYVEVIHRHHKRTPYASNTFPHETYSWTCDDEALFYYGVPNSHGASAEINWHLYTSPSNPFAILGFNGTCQFPQITSQGLDDSRQHGLDLYGVYHDLLHFLPDNIDKHRVVYRVTNNVITSQVAGQIIEGMYPSTNKLPVQVLIQPVSIDSLEPTYCCSTASRLYSSYGVGSSHVDWTAHLQQSESLFASLDAISGVNASEQTWHQSFDHYFDNLSARLCHAKPLPCKPSDSSLCISKAEAEAVFRHGQHEYSYIYRDSPQSLNASTASYGVWVAELATNMRQVIDGSSATLYRHNIAHDGSISRLLSILQINVMVWPGMGSEVVFELFSKQDAWYVRVLWSGQVMRSSNPSLGLIDLVPVEILLAYFDGLVGAMARKIPRRCSESAL